MRESLLHSLHIRNLIDKRFNCIYKIFIDLLIFSVSYKIEIDSIYS